METQETTVPVTHCPICDKLHDHVRAVKLAELGPKKETHTGECPDNPGKTFPVWHSGA